MFSAACFFAVEYLKQLNPLTLVPPVTAMRKPTPNISRAARNRPKKKEHMGTIAFPTLSEDLLALFMFYCSLGQINQSEFTYRAYFYRALGVSDRRFFVLKSCARKVQVIMAHCGQVYQLSSSCFRS